MKTRKKNKRKVRKVFKRKIILFYCFSFFYIHFLKYCTHVNKFQFCTVIFFRYFRWKTLFILFVKPYYSCFIFSKYLSIIYACIHVFEVTTNIKLSLLLYRFLNLKNTILLTNFCFL